MKRALAMTAIFTACILLPQTVFAAYTDEIAVKADEIWEAARETLAPVGIRKENKEKKTLETKWITDTTVRASPLLGELSKQSYERKYRMKVNLRDRHYSTEVTIRGIYKMRPTGNAPGSPWRPAEPQVGEFELERKFFNDILGRLEQKRRANRIGKPA